MYKKAKSFILLAIIVLSSVVGAITIPQNASAATANLYLSDKMKTADRQIALRNSLALCVNYEVTTILGSTRSMKDGDGRGDEVSRSDIASGNWFYDGDEPKARTGAIVDPDNGTVECRNLFKGRNVAKDLGYGSNIELACAIGLKRTDGSNCLTGDGDRFTAADTSAGKVYDALDKKLGISNYNNAQLYVLAAVTYLTTCGGKAVVNVDDANPDQVANTDKYDTITVVTGTGSTKKVLFTKKNNDKVGFRNLNNGDFNYIEENCDWMKDRMNEYAGAYAAWVKQPGNQAPDGDNAGPGVITDDDEEAAEESTCSVAGVGWIICPIVNNLLAPIADASYAFVAALLTVEPLTTDDNNQVYQAWTVMRDFANIAFVIAFLIIVFSQLTNIGINNYGIKKMLPRLILAAVLVNVSYWICAIAVDLSNIAGASMRGVFADTAGNITIPEGGAASNASGTAGWVSLAATGLVATGAALYIGLSALLPALIFVLFTILVVAIVLLIRQVLIVLLIVVSPLAFVAYLLPNTESLFTKWRKLFGNLLLLFPIVGLIFGASELASKVITAAAPDQDYSFAFQVMGAATAVVPLVLVPAMIKGAKAFGGALGGRFGNFLNNPNKGPFDRMRKGAEGYRKNREQLRDARALNDGSYRFGQTFVKRRARRQAVLQQRERNLRNAQSGYVADTALSDEVSRSQRALSAVSGGRLGGQSEGEQLLGQMAKGGGEGGQNAALAQAISNQASIRADEVKASSMVLDHLDVNQEDTLKLAQGREAAGLSGSNEAVRAAAMQRVANTGDVAGMNTLVDQMGEMNRTAQQDLVDALKNSKEKPAYLSPGVLAQMREGKVGVNEITGTRVDANGNKVRDVDANGKMLSVSEQLRVNAINNNTYSPSKLVATSKDELKAVADIATNSNIQSNSAALAQNAQTAHSDNRLASQIGKNQEEFERIRSLAPPTPPPGPSTP